ncbi:MAG: metallophosphoesterase family protein [Candidatus Hadarchaeota archaeon]
MYDEFTILAISDIHGEMEGIRNLYELVGERHDVLLVLGDITQFGDETRAREILHSILKVSIDVLFIPGNCDPKVVHDVLVQEDISIHSRCREVGGYYFVGLGGSNRTPFDTPFEISEDRIWGLLEEITPFHTKKWFLATHAPPKDTLADLTSDGRHVGSESIRKIVRKGSPIINFCGHIHEAQSVDTIGDTKIVNVGSISRGKAAEASVEEENVEVKLLEV